jgi:hypothetical protein
MDSLLSPILSLTYQQLASFASTYSAWDVFDTAFGSMYNSEQVNVLLSQWKSGDFSGFPSIEIRDRAEINGANGAFATTTGKIYLAQEFVDANGDQPEVIAAVLLEEYGHYLDSQINLTDSAGDEGNIFARSVQGEFISEPELAVLKSEDDTATLLLDGQVVQVEQNTQSGQFFQATSKADQPIGTIVRLDGIIGGNDIFNVNFETPSGIVGLNINVGTDSPFGKFAKMAIPDQSSSLTQNYIMDMGHLALTSAINIASAASSNIPFIGTISSVAAAKATAVLDATLLSTKFGLDMAANTAAQDELNNFLNNPDNSKGWGNVNVIQSISTVQIYNFEIGKDSIILPDLPVNWNYAVMSTATYSDNGQKYISLGYKNGSNAPTEFLNIGST